MPGSDSSSAWSAWLRSISPPTLAPPATLAAGRSTPSSGTSTLVPSSRGWARFSDSLASARSTRGAKPPAASMASPTRSPTCRRCKPGRATAPATSMTSSSPPPFGPRRQRAAAPSAAGPSSDSPKGTAVASGGGWLSTMNASAARAAPASMPPSPTNSGTSSPGMVRDVMAAGRPALRWWLDRWWLVRYARDENVRPRGIASFNPSLLPAGGGGGDRCGGDPGLRGTDRSGPGLG